MKVIDTPISGLKIIEPKCFKDARGYFLECYNTSDFENAGMHYNFVQDNESLSSHGVIRGLHYQLDPWSQAKLVRVQQGVVYDVAVDLRKGSPTFGQWFGVELSAENKRQFMIPRGFAHGFSVLSETAIFAYKCDNYYNKESERGIRFDDDFLKIDWGVKAEKVLVSDRDRNHPAFTEAEMNFNF
jgi:dTDP-4-dehydrorhamnose 3,5-epimerase